MADDKAKELIPELDREFLEEKGYTFELIPTGGEVHLVLKDYDFPPAYAPRKADLLIIIPPGYPNAALDMFWTFPDVKLTNGNWPDRCEHHQVHNGRNWQRWSRHFQPQTPWRPGLDSLKTFLAVVRKEIDKGI